MAEIQTDEAARRKRRRTLIGWLAVTAALVLAFALVPRLYAPDKDDISGQSGHVLEPYCRCLWEEPMQKLSTEDLRSLPKLSPQQQLDKLGGSEAFLQRQEQCLAAQVGH